MSRTVGRLACTSCAVFIALCAAAQTAPTPVQLLLSDQIAAILAAPAVARDHWGIAVTTLDGSPIYSLNDAQLFHPASNAKLFTTAAALALLGPDQRFTTRVEYGSAGDKSKAVRGDVTIVGSGDANFSDRALPYRPAEIRSAPLPPVTPLRYLADFADQIAASGVKRVTGDIVGDDTLFPWEPYPEGWSIDDMVWGYGAPVSALSINDNQVLVTITPGNAAGDLPTVKWPDGIPAYYQIDSSNLITGPRKSPSHIEFTRDSGSKFLHISGSIAAGSEPDAEQIAIADPAEFTAFALKEMLEARGVKVEGITRAKHRIDAQSPGFLAESKQSLPKLPAAINPNLSKLLTGQVTCFDACPLILQHTSPPVLEDVVLTSKVSQNLHAELLLHHLGKQDSDGSVEGSTAEGARVVRQWLINAGIDPNDFVFYDGSGLSSKDLVTPRAIAKLLSYAAHDPKTTQPQPWFDGWKSSLPIGGVDGSLESRFTQPPLKGHIFAKTGTIGEARALSGYLDCASGRTVIFSILIDNHLPGTTADREAMDTIVAAIQASN